MLLMVFLWKILGNLQVLVANHPCHQLQYALGDDLLLLFHVRMLYKSIVQVLFEQLQLRSNQLQVGNIMDLGLYSIINFLLCMLRYLNFPPSEM